MGTGCQSGLSGARQTLVTRVESAGWPTRLACILRIVAGELVAVPCYNDGRSTGRAIVPICQPKQERRVPELKVKRSLMPWRQPMTIDERKSRVRVWVTKAAATWVFVGSAAIVAALWIEELDADKLQAAKDIYMTVLPVATGVITYWFASRGISNRGNEPPDPKTEKVVEKQ